MAEYGTFITIEELNAIKQREREQGFHEGYRQAMSEMKAQETEFIYDKNYVPFCKECGMHPFHGYLPSLELAKEWNYKYCPGCGKAVKWE